MLEQVKSFRALMVVKAMHQVIKSLLKQKELVLFFENITPAPDKEDGLVLFLERRAWVYVFGHTDIKPSTIAEKLNIL